MTERINKVLAQLGFGSRRSVDALIEAGRVQVNAKPATIGQQIAQNDILTVDGTVISRDRPRAVILAFHKPKGVVTTKRDRFAKVTVMNYLPAEYQHLFPVGRLDRMSRGLLLLTNDGELAQTLQHPRYHHEKEYEVTVRPNQPWTTAEFTKAIQRLAREIVNPEYQSYPPTIVRSRFNEKEQFGYVTVVLQEGKNRQIRRLFDALNLTVTDLFRTRIGKLKIGTLSPGRYVIVEQSSIL